MKEMYQMERDELYEKLQAKADGLTVEEATKRLRENGENVLQEEQTKGVMQVFLEQFCDFLVIILIIAAIISMLSGNVESTVVIFVVLLLNAVLGTVQYVKARKSLDALKALSSPHAKVLRGGKKQEILSKEVVPGDVLLLEAGDMVAADGRIMKNYSLQVNESSLTGESTNVDKSDRKIMDEVPLADRINMVYAGSLVTYGRAEVLVTGTGMNTEMGKIAGLLNNAGEKKTPLQVSLDDFGKKLAIGIMAVCVLVFGLRMYQGEPLLDSMMFAVALAVAAIPEALGSIVTIVQAMGVRKMANDNAIMKELKAVESLGCVSVICSDKTGTLTQNRMTVREIYLDGKCFLPEEMDIKERLHRDLLYAAILNNDASISGEKEIGDPTECCLLEMAQKAGLKKAGVSSEDIRDMMPRLAEIPFDSDRKLMSTKYRVHGKEVMLTKGAVDVLVERVTKKATTDNVHEFTVADRAAVLEQNEQFSQKGLRVLAFAYKEMGEGKAFSTEEEYNYTFLGLVAMIDPPREESRAAVADATDAGIRTVMITGDHKVTATAIAKEIGIFIEGDVALTGQALDALSNEELDAQLERVSVYARVSPENKIRIVEAWQRKGKIVAMTGDGVNDAPALKKADIGVAMGITGTEVSKDAAAMILSDDNFATIMKAVLNGRNVYRNICNAIWFLLSGNMAGILVVLFCSFAALTTPFEPVHLLFINLLTDSLPALAIGMEPSDRMLLKEKPRNPKHGILTAKTTGLLLWYGGLIAVATLYSFGIGLRTDAATASTMAFATLSLARLFHGFNCRSERPLREIGISSNKWSIAAFGTGVALLALVLFVPFLEKLFLVAPLTGTQVGTIGLLALAPTVIIQIGKEIRHCRHGR